MLEGYNCTDRTHQIKHPPTPKWLQSSRQGLSQGRSCAPQAWQTNRSLGAIFLQGDSHRLSRYAWEVSGQLAGLRWPSVSERLYGCLYQSPSVDANQRGSSAIHSIDVRTGCMSDLTLGLKNLKIPPRYEANGIRSDETRSRSEDEWGLLAGRSGGGTE